MKITKKKVIAKILLAVIIFVSALFGLQKVMTAPDYRNYQWVRGFYGEPENTLDAVYLGSSNCYAFWNPMTAWQEYGIAVWPYAACNATFLTTEYMIKEARKTQPDAVFLVNLNTVDEESTEVTSLHHLLDYMPFSLNKVEMVQFLGSVLNFDSSQKMELLFPLLRYHDRWSELKIDDFSYGLDGMKGASYYPKHLKNVVDISASVLQSDESEALAPPFEKAMKKLLDYCDQEQVKIVFVSVPRAEQSMTVLRQINRLKEMAEERGYPTLYLTDKMDEVGLNPATDFYNRAHTNIHGSIRFTRYVSEYLIENYGFADKRAEETYRSWEQGWENYWQELTPYVLSEELNGTQLDDGMEAPGGLTAVPLEGMVTVSWNPVEGADSYRIYRKHAVTDSWELLSASTETSYTDNTTEPGSKYYYTVLPCREENQETYYGRYKYNGVSVKTF